MNPTRAPVIRQFSSLWRLVFFWCRAIVCSVVTDCISNVVMLDILAVKLSLSLANKVAVTTLRCNTFLQKWFSDRGSVSDPAGSLQCSADPLSGFRGGETGNGREGRKGIGEQGQKGKGNEGKDPLRLRMTSLAKPITRVLPPNSAGYSVFLSVGSTNFIALTVLCPEMDEIAYTGLAYVLPRRRPSAILKLYLPFWTSHDVALSEIYFSSQGRNCLIWYAWVIAILIIYWFCCEMAIQYSRLLADFEPLKVIRIRYR